METKEIVFFQTMSGKHTIRQGDQEILIDLSKMKLDQKSTLLNGLGNLLTSLACRLE